MDDTRKVLLTRFAAEMFVAALLVAIGVLVAYGAAGLGYGWTSSGPDSGYVPFYLGWGIGLAGMGIAISSYLERERYRARVFLTLDGARDVLSFFLPMVLARVVLLRSGIVTDVGTISLLTLIAAVAGPALFYFLVKWSGHGGFLFERPRWAYIDRAPAGRRVAIPAE